MVQWLNRKFLFLVSVLFAGELCFSQSSGELPVYKDYKDPEQFEKFRKRSIIVGAWQINTLKEGGAIIVKLKTNKLLIDQLLKQGNTELALQKQLEQYAINKNTLFAFKENFNFCKVYFMYSNSSDTLLNGARQGFFLDTALNVDPAIIMEEKFYLLAERDYVYTSSIGFIREDSARFIKETGNPIKQMAFVLKNKYGHQLKNPFPFTVKEKNFTNIGYNFPVKFNTDSDGKLSVHYAVNRTYLLDLKTKPEPKKVEKKENGFTFTTVKIRKEFTYEKLSLSVSDLNESLYQFLKSYTKPDLTRVKEEMKIFLY